MILPSTADPQTRPRFVTAAHLWELFYSEEDRARYGVRLWEVARRMPGQRRGQPVTERRVAGLRFDGARVIVRHRRRRLKAITVVKCAGESPITMPPFMLHYMGTLDVRYCGEDEVIEIEGLDGGPPQA